MQESKTVTMDQMLHGRYNACNGNYIAAINERSIGRYVQSK